MIIGLLARRLTDQLIIHFLIQQTMIEWRSVVLALRRHDRQRKANQTYKFKPIHSNIHLFFNR